MKKRLSWAFVVAMVLTFVLSLPVAAEEEFTVHAKAPAEWTTPALWAWSTTEGTNVFDAWPGQVLTADPDNAGWFYFTVPVTTDAVIINDNGAGAQTADLTVESKELWVTVTEAGADGKFAADVAYEAPEGFSTGAVVAVEEATEATTEEVAAEEATTEVPKTGVVSMALAYVGLAGISGAGLIASKKKSK